MYTMLPAQRRAAMFFVAGVLLIVAIVPGAPQTSSTTTVAVIGDLGISMDAERNVDVAVAGGAKGLIGLGDYNYDGSIRGWKAMVQPLTTNGAWFARGNHDDLNAFKVFMPGQSPQWSVLIGNVRVIAIDTEGRIDEGNAQYNWLVGELSREPASGGKIVVMHKPWWLGSGAHHPSWEFPGSPPVMDNLMSSHGVDMVFASHEHNYQRTQRNNIPYLIVGTGGRSIYPVAGSDPGTVATCACYGHALLTIGPTSIQSRFVKLDNTQLDSVTVQLPNQGFTASFAPVSFANDNWVEVKVTSSESLAKTYVKINGGAWYLLTLQSWGNWARALTVPDGATVQFRTFNAANEYVTSGVMTWDTPFTATFSPQSVGNDNWVEVRVSTTHTVDRTYAKINGGPWYLLTKQESGAYGRALSAPNGSTVQFRSFDTDGAYATSSEYTWT